LLKEPNKVVSQTKGLKAQQEVARLKRQGALLLVPAKDDEGSVGAGGGGSGGGGGGGGGGSGGGGSGGGGRRREEEEGTSHLVHGRDGGSAGNWDVEWDGHGIWDGCSDGDGDGGEGECPGSFLMTTNESSAFLVDNAHTCSSKQTIYNTHDEMTSA
jgi:hypothetical protein